MNELKYVNINLQPVIPTGIINYENASDETLASKGYYRVVEPTYNEDLEKLDNLHIEGNIATYDVIPLTTEELEQKEQERQIQQMQEFISMNEQNGRDYYNKKRVEVTAQLFGRPASEVNPILAEIDTIIEPILLKVKSGDWYSAMVMQVPTPTIQEVQDLLNEVRTYVTNYVVTNYQN